MLAYECLPVGGIPKCLCAPCASDRERPCAVCELQTVLDLGPADELVDETRVKRIARTDGIHSIYHGWKCGVFFFSDAGHRSLRATFDHQESDSAACSTSVVCASLHTSRSLGRRMSTYRSKS